MEQQGGKQFHLSQGQANASVAEKTLQQYSDNATGVGGPASKPKCFGCGHPHPWLKLIDGKYIVVCPNAHEPGIKEKVELNIQKYQTRTRKHTRNNKKRRNLNTVNWEDIPKKCREVLAAQQRVLLSVTAPLLSVALALRGGMGASVICRGHITFHQDVIILSFQSLKPQILITIHSPMSHLNLQTGTLNKERDCPALRCMFNTSASLNTANFHYMEAVIQQYPHILKAIYLPDDYAAIILLGIVTSPTEASINTKLSVGFKIHLPYFTKEGNETSLLVMTGPDIAVNLILSLPFIKTTGMIADFINNVC